MILHVPQSQRRFRGMVGTGGIGHGSLFLVDGNENVGREESRSGRFLDRRDYCKLHIISHYVSILLGESFAVYPVGRVGEDEFGRALCTEMAAAGMRMSHVRAIPGKPTLYSFCFVYPDGCGGNFTTRDSASASVSPEAIGEANPLLGDLGHQGIALAVPEVPLEAREALLDAGARYGLFRAASFTRAEMEEVRRRGTLARVDLCALNLEEALAAAGLVEHEEEAPQSRAQRAVEALSRDFPRLWLSITGGATGSWCWDGRGLTFDAALPVGVAGTSGAGDAHLAGVLCGLVAGLTPTEAQELGTLIAAASVMSPHTIHPAMTADLLRAVCEKRHRTTPRVRALLDTANGAP